MGRCSCAHFVNEADLPVVFLELMNLQCAELHDRRSTLPSKITMLQCSSMFCMHLYATFVNLMFCGIIFRAIKIWNHMNVGDI